MIDPKVAIEYGAVTKHYNKGQLIFQEGTACVCYHQVVSGRVRWSNIYEDGKEFLQTMVEAGESFGELPLFDGEPYAATAIAEENCEILRMPKTRFHDLLREHPDFHFAFSELLASRIRYKFFIAKEITHREPEHRIEAIISYLKAHQRNICPECLLLKLTRQQIADMAGLRVETVIRAMRKMHEEGKILIRKGRVYLGDMTAVITQEAKGEIT